MLSHWKTLGEVDAAEFLLINPQTSARAPEVRWRRWAAGTASQALRTIALWRNRQPPTSWPCLWSSSSTPLVPFGLADEQYCRGSESSCKGHWKGDDGHCTDEEDEAKVKCEHRNSGKLNIKTPRETEHTWIHVPECFKYISEIIRALCVYSRENFYHQSRMVPSHKWRYHTAHLHKMTLLGVWASLRRRRSCSFVNFRVSSQGWVKTRNFGKLNKKTPTRTQPIFAIRIWNDTRTSLKQSAHLVRTLEKIATIENRMQLSHNDDNIPPTKKKCLFLVCGFAKTDRKAFWSSRVGY